MCTVSWLYKDTGYALVFNRDEQKTRLRASPPSLKKDHLGNSYLAPTDTDAGGSWLMVNAFGLTACLLNFYEAGYSPELPALSRGEIVLKFGSCRSMEEAEAIVKQMDFSVYRGFDLLIFQEKAEPIQYRWNGRNLESLTPYRVFTSSSVLTEEVCAHRLQLFETTQPTSIAQMLEYHQSHQGPSLAHSPCMHRADAQTVSQCVVEVLADVVSIRYVDGSPCCNDFSSTIELERHYSLASTAK